MTIQDLPLINACLNTLATVFLALGFVFIKKGNQTAHKKCMISAFITSTVFLICYLIYHFSTGATKFVDPAWFKPIYLVILFTHVVLAVVILPLIFMTFSRALKALQIDKQAWDARVASADLVPDVMHADVTRHVGVPPPDVGSIAQLAQEMEEVRGRTPQ